MPPKGSPEHNLDAPKALPAPKPTSNDYIQHVAVPDDSQPEGYRWELTSTQKAIDVAERGADYKLNEEYMPKRNELAFGPMLIDSEDQLFNKGLIAMVLEASPRLNQYATNADKNRQNYIRLAIYGNLYKAAKHKGIDINALEIPTMVSMNQGRLKFEIQGKETVEVDFLPWTTAPIVEKREQVWLKDIETKLGAPSSGKIVETPEEQIETKIETQKAEVIQKSQEAQEEIKKEIAEAPKTEVIQPEVKEEKTEETPTTPEVTEVAQTEAPKEETPSIPEVTEPTPEESKESFFSKIKSLFTSKKKTETPTPKMFANVEVPQNNEQVSVATAEDLKIPQAKLEHKVKKIEEAEAREALIKEKNDELDAKLEARKQNMETTTTSLETKNINMESALKGIMTDAEISSDWINSHVDKDILKQLRSERNEAFKNLSTSDDIQIQVLPGKDSVEVKIGTTNKIIDVNHPDLQALTTLESLAAGAVLIAQTEVLKEKNTPANELPSSN